LGKKNVLVKICQTSKFGPICSPWLTSAKLAQSVHPGSYINAVTFRWGLEKMWTNLNVRFELATSADSQPQALGESS
jgi:hypothetical protein